MATVNDAMSAMMNGQLQKTADNKFLADERFPPVSEANLTRTVLGELHLWCAAARAARRRNRPWIVGCVVSWIALAGLELCRAVW